MHHNANVIDSLQRLRIAHRIIGYRRVEQGVSFFSKDLFWWDGTLLPFTETDDATTFKTQENRVLFENDIIEVIEKNWLGIHRVKKQFRIAKTDGELALIELNTNQRQSLNYLQDVAHFSFMSYTFINKEALSLDENH